MENESGSLRLSGNTLGSWFHPRYKLVRELNRGQYGVVQLCIDRQTKEQVAIKLIPRGDKITSYVEGEIINHCLLSHPHVVQFKEVFLTDEYLGIAMEYVSGGDSFEHMLKRGGHVPEDEARFLFQQLIIALDYCHKKGVACRDIKLENTLVEVVATECRPILKLCDFGYSKSSTIQSQPNSLVGTPDYVAPEVIRRGSQREAYNGQAADVWSAGVFLYTLLVGFYPFARAAEDAKDQNTVVRIFERILSAEYHIPSGIHLSPLCKDLIQKILVPDPTRRITIAQIYRHPWFLEELPAGAARWNDDLVRSPLPVGLQSVDEILRIVKEAQVSHRQTVDRFDDFGREFVDDVIDNVIDKDDQCQWTLLRTLS